MTARLYECRITHARTVPLRNVFSYRVAKAAAQLKILGPPPEPPAASSASAAACTAGPATRP